MKLRFLKLRQKFFGCQFNHLNFQTNVRDHVNISCVRKKKGIDANNAAATINID